jgi:hypothetical protein
MSAIDGGRIRIELTREEVAAMVRLAWDKMQSYTEPGSIPWELVRLFAILVKAARDKRLDISKPEVKGGEP